MATEVLLMTDVADLGSEGDIVKVADGYARNYLFPKKFGAPVTDATRKRLAKIRQERESTRKAELDAAREIADRLAKISCTVLAKIGKDEKMYGSVTTADVAEALRSQGVEEVDKNMLLFDKPIKELGVYDVKVKLHPEVESTVRVWIVEE